MKGEPEEMGAVGRQLARPRVAVRLQVERTSGGGQVQVLDVVADLSDAALAIAQEATEAFSRCVCTLGIVQSAGLRQSGLCSSGY